jgi:hypothetical protein
MQTERTSTSVGQGVLQSIFAVFLGLMITAVVGVGVYTFYPNPADETQQQITAAYERRDEVQGCTTSTGCKPTDQLTDQQQGELQSLDRQTRELEQKAAQQRDAWAQGSSVILVTIATGLMVVSLTLGEALNVLSNGILLGGLFTMLYGVGWGVASGSSSTRFVVLVVALVISLVLGYLKFARHRGGPSPRVVPMAAGTAGVAVPGAAAAGPGPVPSGDLVAVLSALTGRVSDLEKRMAAAGALLAPPAQPPEEEAPAPQPPTGRAVP